ncbi:hypothetical protein PANDA_005236 [Ailuropoda melanoleuca]|uniref:Uncharacterized protein n=1 Tax=Ailuropoda melanoleuca TaxID=9646 RepID=D2H5P8_AILME|nr:hypothetical protein PANDA_005236 [Ailuropoda melanoleuca]
MNVIFIHTPKHEHLFLKEQAVIRLCKAIVIEDTSQVILTNQITTHLSRALASQADLVSPADDLSLSEENWEACQEEVQRKQKSPGETEARSRGSDVPMFCFQRAEAGAETVFWESELDLRHDIQIVSPRLLYLPAAADQLREDGARKTQQCRGL